jgi:SSS family solute:Na+ symporter
VLYEYLQGVQGLLAPAIASVFLLGVFWKRMTAKAAFWGMITGFSLGMFRLVLNVFFSTKVALINESEKIIQTITNATYVSVQQVQGALHALSGKISDVAGASGDAARQAIDSANGMIATGITPENQGQALQAIAQAKTGLSQMYHDQYGFLFQLASVNWLHVCVLLFFICLSVMVLISLVTEKPGINQLRYTYGAATAEEKTMTRASWGTWDVIHTIIILAIVVSFYIYFW